MSAVVEDRWVRIAPAANWPVSGGVCAKVGDTQVAIFSFGEGEEWYACQNMCPHKRDMVLSRGLLGDSDGEPKVACPQHKKTFSLRSGSCLSGEDYAIRTFPVKVEEGYVYLALPSEVGSASGGVCSGGRLNQNVGFEERGYQ